MKTDIQTRLKPFCPEFHLPSTHIGFFFENDNFFLCYQKNSVRFCPSTRLKTTWLKKGPIFYGSMHIYWYSTPWRNSFPKTSIFVHPHECSKMASSKPLLWEHFWKDAFSMAIFTWYMWTVGQNQKKSVFLNNRYVWMGPHVDLQQIYTWENYMEDEYLALLHN